MDDPLDDLIEIPARARRLYPRGRRDGLEPTALQVLACLARDGQLTTQVLAATLELEPSTVRHALAELRQRGLVTAVEDPHDARRRPHRVTAGGETVVRKLQESAR